jgi:hypothetical protein
VVDAVAEAVEIVVDGKVLAVGRRPAQDSRIRSTSSARSRYRPNWMKCQLSSCVSVDSQTPWNRSTPTRVSSQKSCGVAATRDWSPGSASRHWSTSSRPAG